MNTTQDQINEKNTAIINAKNNLSGTDYIGHKVVDAIVGVLVGPSPTIGKIATEVKSVLVVYPEYLNSRQNSRADINKAQAVVKQLEALQNEEQVSLEAMEGGTL